MTKSFPKSPMIVTHLFNDISWKKVGLLLLLIFIISGIILMNKSNNKDDTIDGFDTCNSCS